MGSNIDWDVIDKAGELGEAAFEDIRSQANEEEPDLEQVTMDARVCYSLSAIVLTMLSCPPSCDFDVRGRIEAMRDRPVMWAGNREGFILQLKLLLDVAGIPTARSDGWMNACCGLWTATVNNVWGARVATSALKLLDASLPHPPRDEVAADEAQPSPKQ